LHHFGVYFEFISKKALGKYEDDDKHSEKPTNQSCNFTADQLKKALHTGYKDSDQWSPRQGIFTLQQELKNKAI